MRPTPTARTSARILTPVVLDALSVDERHAPRLASLEGIDVLWVAESVREAREVLDGLGQEWVVIDLSLPREEARLHLEGIERSGGDPFTVVVAASDAPGLEPVRRSLREDAFLCRSARIRELPRLLREIVDAWS
jgi:response regulator of citrate/malate metabolism